ncbi:taste receptor type 2 member 38-like [Paramisgurnus dabryanus]|uniref:taste receptor type 2 member 38-like n=1 Tax=Paramisgurnus dabryanus TaxID=90735 RepID=UPI0031F35C85
MISIVDKLGIWLMTGMLAILTIFFNMYLMLVILRSYQKKQKLNPCDLIIVAINVASIGLQVFTYLWQSLDQIDIYCSVNFTTAVMLSLVYSTKFIVFWCTAFLTFYYGTKLVMRPVDCYKRMQETIIKHVRLVLVVIYMSGFSHGMPFLALLHNYNVTSTVNDCGSIMPSDINGLAYVFYYIFISDIVPSIVMIKSSISIMFHLYHHLQDMKASTNGARGPKLGTQMRVIKMTLTLVVVFCIFVVIDLIVESTVALKRQNTITVTVLVASMYTTVSAAVLVYGKKSHWKDLISTYNLFLDEYPCLTGLKVAEVKTEPQENSNN